MLALSASSCDPGWAAAFVGNWLSAIPEPDSDEVEQYYLLALPKGLSVEDTDRTQFEAITHVAAIVRYGRIQTVFFTRESLVCDDHFNAEEA